MNHHRTLTVLSVLNVLLLMSLHEPDPVRGSEQSCRTSGQRAGNRGRTWKSPGIHPDRPLWSSTQGGRVRGERC